MSGKHWDIFCTVVDNFGDIGVCWRLARQLASEHGLAVRLWVDDLDSFHHLCPQIDPQRDAQTHRGVEVRRWATPFPPLPVGDTAAVVIEAFACDPPESYLAAMAASPEKPVWINLDYLSAEDWIVGSHGLASPHPPLSKHFFFPGFVAGSGGLLREASLIRQRHDWLADPEAGWRQLGLPPAQPGETSISLFCYENPALPELLQAWATGGAPVRCLVPHGKAWVQLASILGCPPMQAGDVTHLGKLSLHALPFLSQENYDRLLWSCDLNFVRGEDSLVRALWAARPLAWHIYPQQDAAHLTKLSAFLDLYCAGLSQPATAACRDFWRAWNQAPGLSITTAWETYWQQRDELAAHALRWAELQAEQADLAENLVNFCRKLAIISD
ncbi:MAG: elongation factor P maturation arginine rhamnosyltransferase EarP [Betaproteobacteria bacterium]|nr:elongation factor P maturation arginine rhamnosyltransferase EarP [Betaproteobacteria bacterium]